MTLWKSDESSNRRGLKIVGMAVGLTLAVVMAFESGPLWAARADSEGLKAARAEHEPLFKALDQWMNQNSAAYEYDLSNLGNPFMPIKAVRGLDEGGDDDGLCGGSAKALSQWKLTAITIPEGGSGSLATFEDGAGYCQNVRRGDRLERSNGRIMNITATSVTVEVSDPCTKAPPQTTVIELLTPGRSAGLTRSGR